MGSHSLSELWATMPLFAKIIWFILAIMSVWSLSVAISKWWGMRKAQQETRKFAPEFAQFLEEDNLAEAIKLAEGYKKSHVARVLGNALDEVKPLIMDGSVTVRGWPDCSCRTNSGITEPREAMTLP